MVSDYFINNLMKFINLEGPTTNQSYFKVSENGNNFKKSEDKIYHFTLNEVAESSSVWDDD